MVRDDFDNGDVGIVLIGMPGFERRLARYPQLYSRVGFAHQHRPLDSTDIPQVLAKYWQELGLTYDPHRTGCRSGGCHRPHHRRQLRRAMWVISRSISRKFPPVMVVIALADSASAGSLGS